MLLAATLSSWPVSQADPDRGDARGTTLCLCPGHSAVLLADPCWSGAGRTTLVLLGPGDSRSIGS
ncbi:hypothetical protein PSEUDO8Z_10525 [Pseudomonas sp. 8Z]|nr:hypothetical protein PSEUDO8Z_10525 [Pseudomonas sp. 8Z]